MREPDPCSNSGNRCAVHAFVGSEGKGMIPSCVEVMVEPWATLTSIGLSVGLMLWHLAVEIRKWAVAPLSSAPVVVDVGGEEPSESASSWAKTFL